MDTSHPIVSLLAGGVSPTPDEARDLTALGAFAASFFSRHLHGLGRPPVGTARSGDWASHLAGRLSASTGTRWSDAMGLGAAYDEGAWAGFWALAAGPREGYWEFGDLSRETVALFEEEEAARAAGATPRRRSIRGGSLFGPGRPRRAARRPSVGAAGRPSSRVAGRAPSPALLSWSDGATVHPGVARALTRGGLGVADQLAPAVAGSAEGAPEGGGRAVNEPPAGARGATPAPLTVPQRRQRVGSAAGRHAAPAVRSSRPALRLDSLLVDRRTPALHAALSLADEALAPTPVTTGAFALSASRLGRTLSSGVPGGSRLVAPAGSARAQYFSFFDAVEGDFLALTPETSAVEAEDARVQPSLGASAVGAWDAPLADAPRAPRSVTQVEAGAARRVPAARTQRGVVRLADVVSPRATAVRPWTRDNAVAVGRGGAARGRLAPEVVRDTRGVPMPREHRSAVAATRLWTLPLSAAAGLRGGAVATGEAGGVASLSPTRGVGAGVAAGRGEPLGAGVALAGRGLEGRAGAGGIVGLERRSRTSAGSRSLDATGVAAGAGAAVVDVGVGGAGRGSWLGVDQGPALPLAATLTKHELLVGTLVSRHVERRAGAEVFQPVVTTGSAAGESAWSSAPGLDALDGVAWVVLADPSVDAAEAAYGSGGVGSALGRAGLPLATVPAGRAATMVPASVALAAELGTRRAASPVEGRGATVEWLGGVVVSSPAAAARGGEGLASVRFGGSGVGAGRMDGGPARWVDAPHGRGSGASQGPAAGAGAGADEARLSGWRGVAGMPPGLRSGAATTEVARGGGLVSAVALGEALDVWAAARMGAGLGEASGVGAGSRRDARWAGVARRVTTGAYGGLDAAGVLVALSEARAEEVPTLAAGRGGTEVGRPASRVWRDGAVDARVRHAARGRRGVAWGGRRGPKGSSLVANPAAAVVAARARRALQRPVMTGREAREAAALFAPAGPLSAVLGLRAMNSDGEQGARPLAPTLGRRLGGARAWDVRVLAAMGGGVELARGVAQLGALSPSARQVATRYLRRAGWTEAELEVLHLGAVEAGGGARGPGREAARRGVQEGAEASGLAGRTSGETSVPPSGDARVARRLSRNLARVLAGGEAVSLAGAGRAEVAVAKDGVGAVSDAASLLGRERDSYFGRLGMTARTGSVAVQGATPGEGRAPGAPGVRGGGSGDWLLMDLLSFAGMDERALDVAEAALPLSVRRRVLERAEALGLGPEQPARQRRRGYERIFAELGYLGLERAGLGAAGLEGRLGAALGAVADSGVGRRVRSVGADAAGQLPRSGHRAAGLAAGAGAAWGDEDGGRLDPTLARVFSPEEVLGGLMGRSAAARLAQRGGAGVLTTGGALEGEAAPGRRGTVGARGAHVAAVVAPTRRRSGLSGDSTGRQAEGAALGLGRLRRRGVDRWTERRLGRLLARLGRKERTSVFGRTDSADFALAWLDRVDGRRSGFDLGFDEERGAFDAVFGLGRSAGAAARSEEVGAGRASRVASDSPVVEADLVSPVAGEAAVSGQRDKSGLRRLLRSERASAGVGRGQGASAAMRSVDWRYVETGSTATPAPSVDYGRLAAAAVSELGSSRVALPYVAPAVKAVAQSALLEPKTAPADAPSREPVQQAGGGGNRDAAGGGGQPTLSKAAMKKLAIEMADRVARLLQREKERRGKWA